MAGANLVEGPEGQQKVVLKGPSVSQGNIQHVGRDASCPAPTREAAASNLD